MDKQEEIRGGLVDIISNCALVWNINDLIRDIQKFEASKGVVIKVERELPSREHWDWEKKSFAKDCYFDLMLEAGYAAVEPLMKGE